MPRLLPQQPKVCCQSCQHSALILRFSPKLFYNECSYLAKVLWMAFITGVPAQSAPRPLHTPPTAVGSQFLGPSPSEVNHKNMKAAFILYIGQMFQNFVCLPVFCHTSVSSREIVRVLGCLGWLAGVVHMVVRGGCGGFGLAVLFGVHSHAGKQPWNKPTELKATRGGQLTQALILVANFRQSASKMKRN